MIEVEWDEAIVRKYPEPVVLVVSCDSEGKPNIGPEGWSTITSSQPPMWAISLFHKRYIHELIEETGEYVLVFPSTKIQHLVEATGACSGRDIDKFAYFNIETIKAKYVKPPLIKDAVACFECKVRSTLSTGDHTMFVGEVLTSYISEKYRRRLYNFSNKIFKTALSE